MDVIIVSIGSFGDHHPLLGIGLALKERGHSVTMLANDYFANITRHTGLDFHAIETIEDYYSMLRYPESVGSIATSQVRPMRKVYDYLKHHFIPGKTVVVCNTSASLGVRLAHEQFGLPMVSITLQPMTFNSAYDPPVYSFFEYPAWWPRWVYRGMMELVRLLYDFLLMHHMRTYRKELGLGSQPRRIIDWMVSPQKVIGLFPTWFASPQPDWPANTELTGFPLFDEGALSKNALPEDLEEFLAHGSAPIIFTPGTPNQRFAFFFEKAVQATTAIGARAIFITKFKEQIPDNLPEHIRFYEYLPFSLIFKRASLLVYHGGIGTMAQVMRSGLPHLITPWGFDQFDNCKRIRALGIGDMIRASTCTVETLAAKLKQVMNSPEIQARCRVVAEQIRTATPLADTCRIIEGMSELSLSRTAPWQLNTPYHPAHQYEPDATC